jgi:hypothetical protein
MDRASRQPGPRARTILAETGGAIAGLAHTLLGEHAAWGAFAPTRLTAGDHRHSFARQPSRAGSLSSFRRAAREQGGQ